MNLKISVVIMAFILTGGGCLLPTEQVSDSNFTEINGIVQAGRFGGTEMACIFGEGSVVGDRMDCNKGWVSLAVKNSEGEYIWLGSYSCSAQQYFIKEEDGMGVGYEASECTDDIVVGDIYTFKGILEERKGEWHAGVQQDELWLLNAVLK